MLCPTRKSWPDAQVLKLRRLPGFRFHAEALRRQFLGLSPRPLGFCLRPDFWEFLIAPRRSNSLRTIANMGDPATSWPGRGATRRRAFRSKSRKIALIGLPHSPRGDSCTKSADRAATNSPAWDSVTRSVLAHQPNTGRIGSPSQNGMGRPERSGSRPSAGIPSA